MHLPPLGAFFPDFPDEKLPFLDGVAGDQFPGDFFVVEELFDSDAVGPAHIDGAKIQFLLRGK